MSTAPKEHWFLCGGATSQAAPADATRLAASGPDQNITVDLPGLTNHLLGQLPAEYVDLIFIAAYVLTADSAVRRGDARTPDLGDKLYRKFHLVIGVQRPALWSSRNVRQSLEATLGFLTDDSYSFTFQAAANPLVGQLTFSGPGGKSLLRPEGLDEVLLLSGGLDSLTGALDALHAAREDGQKKKGLVIVSHRSSDKVWAVQKELVEELRRRAGTTRIDHVCVRVTKKDDQLRVEHMQRSRSFLFVALAGAVAHLVGRQRVLLFENGVVGINLPISHQLVGANATRTAHPKVLHGFSQLFSLINAAPVSVENPFALLTRTEVLGRLAAHGAEPLIAKSVSCAHVHNMETERPHCGTCSQCVDRQFAVRAAGLLQHDPQSRYRMPFVEGDRVDDLDRLLLLDYMSTAYRFRDLQSIGDLEQRFGAVAFALPYMGLEATAASQAILELHQRHGAAIGDVVRRVCDEAFDAAQARALPLNSLPMLVRRESIRARAEEDTHAEVEQATGPTEYLFRKDSTAWMLRFRGGPFFSSQDRVGMDYICYLLRRPGEPIAARHLIDAVAGRPPSKREPRARAGMLERTFDHYKKRLRELQVERRQAEEFEDADGIAKCNAETKMIKREFRRAGVLKGRPPPEDAEDRKHRVSVSNNIDQAIKAIRKESPALADHLLKYIQKGSHLWYVQTEIPWHFG